MKAGLALVSFLLPSALALAEPGETTVKPGVHAVMSDQDTEGPGSKAMNGAAASMEVLIDEGYRSQFGPGFDSFTKINASAGFAGNRFIGSAGLRMLFPKDHGSKVGFVTRQQMSLTPQSGHIDFIGVGGRIGSEQSNLSVYANPFSLFTDRGHGSLGIKSSLIAEGSVDLTRHLELSGSGEMGVIYAQGIQDEEFKEIYNGGTYQIREKTQNEIAQEGAGTYAAAELALSANDLVKVAGVPISLRASGGISQAKYKVVEKAADGDVKHDYRTTGATANFGVSGAF